MSSQIDPTKPTYKEALTSDVRAKAIGFGQVGFGTTALITSAIDTTVSTTVVFTGQLTNSGETISLESYDVTLLP